MADTLGAGRRAEAGVTGRDLRLAAEFAVVFVGLPLLMALRIPPQWLWPVMIGVTVAAAVLLSATPGFRWRSLGRAAGRRARARARRAGDGGGERAARLVAGAGPLPGAAAAGAGDVAADHGALSAALGAAAGADLPGAVLRPLPDAVPERAGGGLVNAWSSASRT